MKIIYALIALFSTPAFAAVPAGVPSVTVSAPGANTGQVTVSPSQLAGTGAIFSLYSSAGGTDAHYYPLWKNGTKYQVTAGKTAYCFDITSTDSTSLGSFQLVSATAAISAGDASLTGGVYQGGASTAYVYTDSSTANLVLPMPGVFSFGASTYAGVQTYSTRAYIIHMDCFEQ